MIGETFLKLYFVACLLQYAEGEGCNDYTGADVRGYNFDYTTDTISNADKNLSSQEHDLAHVDTEFVMENNYEISCTCGIVTLWQFFAWRTGTVIFYVLDGTEVIGKTSVHIPEQSIQNFFEVPLSSDQWIQVKSGNRIAFYTEGEPMITYNGGQTGYSMYFSRNVGERNIGDHVAGSGTTMTNLKYAFAAYVEEAHQPMFVNAPYETTLYTHDTGTVVYTATVIDLDNQDVTVTKTSGDPSFVFDPSLLTLTYNSTLAQDSYIVTLQADDGCATHSENIVINLVNEGPIFTNLPASTTVAEDATANSTLYTIATTDPSGDSVTCTLTSNPASGGSIFSLSDFHIVQDSNPNYNYSTTKYYDLGISCSDDQTTRYSNFQVDVVKNEPPYFNAGSGYLPASISVERTAGVTIYTLDYTDPESDAVSISLSCSGGGACPFSHSGAGVISTSGVLDDEAYDLVVTLADAKNSFSATLSIVVSGRPYTFNEDPVFVNLDTTIHVMEHTATDTFLLKVLYTDENPSDTLTLAKVTSNAADTYFTFNASTGIISVKADIDFEVTGAGNWKMEISVNDGSETQHVTVTGTVTFVIMNINEGISLTIGNPAITADETLTRGNAFTSPAISSVDIDAGDTAYYTMNCGEDSRYFYLDTATLQVKFARKYDMDAGMSGTATCNVTVRDEKGLSDTGQITLTVNNINDHYPKFPHNKYVFFVTTTTPFFTELANMAATDADSDASGSTVGTLTYHFDPVSPTEEYFQMDVAGVLFVRNLTTYAANKYVFEVIATDSGGFTGTCTVTVVFRPTSTTVTTTATERSLVFEDEYMNYVWLLLCAAGVLATVVIIALMIWKDPVVNEYINFKVYKLCIWCRKKPKPKVPKRTVGKLRVTVNKKDLENDPDNALPWELLTKDNQGPEVNDVQEMIEHRREKRDRDYKNFSGLPVFEKGKGERPDSGRATVHSSASSHGRPESDSPKYATFMAPNERQDEGGGEGQWGDLTERRVIVTPVAPEPGAEDDGEGQWGDLTERRVIVTPVAPAPGAEDNGEGQWGDLTERRVIVTPVAPAPGAEDGNNSVIAEPRSDSPIW